MEVIETERQPWPRLGLLTHTDMFKPRIKRVDTVIDQFNYYSPSITPEKLVKHLYGKDFVK